MRKPPADWGGAYTIKTARIMSSQVASHRKVQQGDCLIVLALIMLFYMAKPTRLAEPTQILQIIVKKKRRFGSVLWERRDR